MVGVVPGEEIREVRARIFEGAKTLRKVRPILEGFEMRFRIRIVVRDVRPERVDLISTTVTDCSIVLQKIPDQFSVRFTTKHVSRRKPADVFCCSQIAGAALRSTRIGTLLSARLPGCPSCPSVPAPQHQTSLFAFRPQV